MVIRRREFGEVSKFSKASYCGSLNESLLNESHPCTGKFSSIENRFTVKSADFPDLSDK